MLRHFIVILCTMHLSIFCIMTKQCTIISQIITHQPLSTYRNQYLAKLQKFYFPPGATQPIVGVYFTALYRALASSRTRLLDHTQQRVTIGRTPLDE
jgi:hypothetical protein